MFSWKSRHLFVECSFSYSLIQLSEFKHAANSKYSQKMRWQIRLFCYEILKFTQLLFSWYLFSHTAFDSPCLLDFKFLKTKINLFSKKASFMYLKAKWWRDIIHHWCTLQITIHHNMTSCRKMKRYDYWKHIW